MSSIKDRLRSSSKRKLQEEKKPNPESVNSNNLCSNPEDYFGNKYNEMSDNLIVIQISPNNFICMTRNEAKMIIEEYTEKPAIVQSENPDHFKRGEEDRENKLNPDNYFYRIPQTGMWIDNSFKKLYDDKVNTMRVVKMDKVTLMRSVPGISSGMHDYLTDSFKVVPLNRKDLFKNLDRKEVWDDSDKEDEIIEVNISEEETQKMLKLAEEQAQKRQIARRINTIDIGVFLRHADWSPDGKHICAIVDTSYIKNSVQIWDIVESKMIEEFETDDDSFLKHIAWSPDGRYIAGSYDFADRIQIWDLENKTSKKIETPKKIKHISWSPDSRYLEYNTAEKIYIYDILNEKVYINKLEFENDNIDVCEWSKNAKFLAVGNSKHSYSGFKLKNGIVSILNIKTKKVNNTEIELNNALSWSPDNIHIITNKVGTTNLFVNNSIDNTFSEIKFPFETNKLEYFKDGKHVLCVGDRRFSILNLETQNIIPSHYEKSNYGHIKACILSPDNKRVLLIQKVKNLMDSLSESAETIILENINLQG